MDIGFEEKRHGAIPYPCKFNLANGKCLVKHLHLVDKCLQSRFDRSIILSVIGKIHPGYIGYGLS